MGSQVIKVLRQGAWGSLTGGWYYDPRHSKFTNVFHLYTWLILMCLPIMFYMVPTFIPQWNVVCIYTVAVFVIFTGIKITNYRLHLMFDEGTIVEKKEIPANDCQMVAIDKIVSEDNHSTTNHDRAANEDVLPIDNSGRVEETKGATGDGAASKESNDFSASVDSSAGEAAGRKITKRDLEVDVHVDSAPPLPSLDNTVAKNVVKEHPKKKRHRHHVVPSKKAVAFAEAYVQTEKSVGVSHCVSLPSASSGSSEKLETDNDDLSTVSDTSDSNDTATTSTDNEETEKDHHIPHRPRAHAVRRRVIHGYCKHPWYKNPRMITKVQRGSALDSSASSAASEDRSRTTHNNNPPNTDDQSSVKPETSRSLKRSLERMPAMSPQRKFVVLDKTPEENPWHIPKTHDNCAVQIPERDNSREISTSDQELLARDPVCRARRSPRYSSDRTLFFRRRSYVVNSNRSRDTRNRLSTVPPYSGGQFSPRRTQSSLQRLLSLWNRDQSQSVAQTETYSPGQVSPGEVSAVLTGHSVDNAEILNFSQIFFPPEGMAKSNKKTDYLLKVPEKVEFDKQVSDSGSHNSNPHCNEFQESATPKAGGGDDKTGVTNLKSSAKVKTNKRKPRRANIQLLNTKDVQIQYEMTVEQLGLGNTGNQQIKTEVSDDEDMNRFVKDLIETKEVWQGTGSDSGTRICQKRPSLDVERELDADSQIIESLLHRQHSSMWSNTAHETPNIYPSSTVPSRTWDGSGPRVRHFAGNDGISRSCSHDDSGSPTSTTVQHTLNKSTASLADLLGSAPDEIDLPSEATRNLKEVDEDAGVHIATAHDDTSAGATHAFRDEQGNWYTYTFGEASGTAQILSSNGLSSRRSSRARHRLQTHSSVQSGDTSDEPPKSPQTSHRNHRRIQLPSFGGLSLRRHAAGMDISTFLESDLSGSFTQAELTEMSHLDFMLGNGLAPQQRARTPRVKLYYKFHLLPFKSIVMQYDRLALLDLLDRNRLVIENIFATILAMIVAILGLVLLQKGFFHDIWPLWFCAVIATAQYSLVRSVQPDSASPSHGHNRIIAYSRPLYFCILALLILIFDSLSSDSVHVPDLYVYGGIYFTKASCALATNVLAILIMTLPIIFLLGLLPQINTFVMYLSEQIEIHMFGGTACTGLVSALFSLSRSVLFTMCLFGFCYSGMQTEEQSQHPLFSVFCGLLVSFSFHLSRQTNDPAHLWKILKAKLFPRINHAESAYVENATEDSEDTNPDELSSVYVQNTLSERLQSDMIVCPTIAVSIFAIHCSTAFTFLDPTLSLVLCVIAGSVGFITHYVSPQLRKQLPWLLFSNPFLKSHEYNVYEVEEEAKVMWFEKAYVVICFIERNILYPVIIVNELTNAAPIVVDNHGLAWGSIVLTFIGLKLLRCAYSVTLLQYAVLAFASLYSKYDAKNDSDPVLITYFLAGILLSKLQDLMLKLQFIYVYIAPWQITWGSAFHAFAQPFSVPHSGMLLLHTMISSLLHAPLAPFLGSAVFLTSYVRPVKFWERSYNTKRIDHSNTRLASQVDRMPSTDDNNLNSIFYEHLTLSLQKSLCGDIAMGRWGNVYPGDCFIMTSDYLNALIHIIQRGNGVISFQVRGLEFSGTYCQQREVEAISEGVEDRKCCCCSPGHPANMLSFNAAFNQRWLAWQVHTTKFVLDGYSITDNSATSMLGVYDLRKILISYMVKSVIYFLISHDSLEKWLINEGILEAIEACEVPDYVDVHNNFSVTIHNDYDMWLGGISRANFQAVYGTWIAYCASRQNKTINAAVDSKVVTLCFMISVLSRRALETASTNLAASRVALDAFLYGLHSLFKGDFRTTSEKDEWVYKDMDLLHDVIKPGVRMSLKLHQDHFQDAISEEDTESLYLAISENVKEMVITHEGDPEWRRAVLSNRSSLLALRHVAGDAVDSYFVISLKRRSLGFRVVRINKECVKGLWAGQQQELVFLRNSNPERGSIQNAKQVLRNMINSSCDQPIGYPIYVSPVTTSFTNTHMQYKGVIGGSMSIQGIRNCLTDLWTCIQRSCGGSCNSGGSAGLPVGGNLRGVGRPQLPSTGSTRVPPPGVRSSIAGSQSSGSSINVPEGSDQSSSVNGILRTQPRTSFSQESRRIRRLDEYYSRHSVSGSTSGLTGNRSSSRWRLRADGVKILSSHPPGTGSMEMSPVNSRSLIQPSSASRTLRNSRWEGTESPANSDSTLSVKFSVPSIPTGGPRGSTSDGNMVSWRAVQKSSSKSNGDSLEAENNKLAHPSKPVRKPSGDVLDTVTRHTSKARSTSNHKTTIQRAEKQCNGSEKEMVVIADPSRIFETLEIHRQTDHVKWPNDEWRNRGGLSKWGDWRPRKDMIGEVVFKWYPNHRDRNQRAHVGEVILLLRIEDPASKEPFFVPIPEKCTSGKGTETTQL